MKLTHIILTTALTLSSTAVVWADQTHEHAHQPSATQTQQLIQTQGVVESVDLANKKVTVHHDPITSLNWPAMTMRFTAEDVALIQNLKPNDNIRFTFEQKGPLSMLQRVDIVK